MYHYRRARKAYIKYPKPKDCPFCDATELTKAIRETDHAYVLPNRVFYSIWELRKVADHLMIVPKEHVRSLSQLSDDAKLDIMDLIGEYESTDYNIYARAVDNLTRSVTHQHTHLIRTTGRISRLFLYVKKPYITIRF